MTQLTLTRLAEIEQAAADAIQWRTLTANGHHFGNVCDPATVAALCRIAQVAVEWERVAVSPSEWDDFEQAELDLSNALRDAGLLE